jgi:hypothetical protein
MKIRCFLFLSLIFLPALRAVGSISVEPGDPTSNFPVTLLVTQFDSCPPMPVVTRMGFSISVPLVYGTCLFPPGLITWRLDLGLLPAGQYNVTSSSSGGTPSETFSFAVLDANDSVTVIPGFASTAGGTEVYLTTAPHCQWYGPCPSPVVTFGGIAATNVRVVDQTHLVATTPPHVAGAVEVRVTSDSSLSASYSYRYVDPAAAPLPELYERVLLPVVYNGPGAHGANWVTELAVVNDNPVVSDMTVREKTSQLAPATPLRLTLDNDPAGVFVSVPRDRAAGVHFSARSRDVSLESSDWGAELPVVPESQFSQSVALLDIPTDARYRTMLRIYGLQSNASARVTLYSLADGHTLNVQNVILAERFICNPTNYPCADHPASTALADVTAGMAASAERIGIRIEGIYNPSIWAFATITNNETQHVTVVSPH